MKNNSSCNPVNTEGECKGLQTWIQLLTPAPRNGNGGAQECVTYKNMVDWKNLIAAQVFV